MHWTHPPRILSEHLAPLSEPLACLLAPGPVGPPAAVAALGARALLDFAPLAREGPAPWPAWLAPHQVPAAERLVGILTRYGGALLADAVGLGKSYVSLAVALALAEPFALVVPAVLVRQWRGLLERYDTDAPIITHEFLSTPSYRPSPPSTALHRLYIVDEAHRFRNPDTNRYRALAKLVVGTRVLLVTATPVHNRIADLFHLFRLFLRDHDLTALGVSSLWRAAAGEADPLAVTGAAARLCVSRSRERVRAGYGAGPAVLSFPERATGETIRVGAAPDGELRELVSGVAELEAGGEAAGLFRLLLLSQLASSLPAFRASLERYEAFLELGRAAAAAGRVLGRRAFRQLIPSGTDELQLAFFPLVLPPGRGPATERDRGIVRRLQALAGSPGDPKADALAALLDRRAKGRKTIVFVQSRATVHHLVRRLRGLRLAAVTGERGWFGGVPVGRQEVLRAFAPRAQGAPPPVAALETDVLVATDLLSEGLNLQDAARVIHYDLPWSPARLTQRVGRIDRAGSSHERIETVTFLPPQPLADALAMERRLIAKQRMQARAGAGPRGFDWCDRLHGLTARAGPPAAVGSCAAAVASERAVVLVVRLGSQVEGVVVTDAGVRADPECATRLLEGAAVAVAAPFDRAAVEQAIRRAAPLLRARLAALEDARWRAAHRDRVSRRLIPWVLAAARRAATRRRHADLARLDGLVSRLALGMTAGEELRLEDLLSRRAPLAVRDVLAWHDLLPPVGTGAAAGAPQVELVAAMVLG